MGLINCKESLKRDDSMPVIDYKQDKNDVNTHNGINTDSDVIEKEICGIDDIAENEMKEFELAEDQKILLIKKQGNFHAIGTKCPHYGAPLIKGTLGSNCIRCPWHGACFNLETGDIEDFPGLDSIPCYKVTVTDNQQVNVIAKKSDLEKNRRLKMMQKRCTSNQEIFIVIGGGPSAAVCVETLRQEGFTGRIIMICKENVLPYDRVKISKSFSFDIKNLQLRDEKFYKEYDIEILLNTEASNVDVNKKLVTCSNGLVFNYDKLYIATGCKPRRLNVLGSELKNIKTIRDFSDTEEILGLLKPDMEVVCLGTSFIGLEAAACLVGKVKQITVIGRDEYPLELSFGKEIGKRILKLFEDKGIKMIMKNEIIEYISDDDDGNESTIKFVKLQDGNDVMIKCDLLILGIGVTMCTEFLENSGIKINKNGSIETDSYLMTNIQDIYAGGDIVNAPIFSLESNEKAVIGHYQLAQYHGRIAALNMIGKRTVLKAIPFFFASFFGYGLRYSGYGIVNEVRIEGDLEKMKFLIIYFDKNENVIAMASCNQDPIVVQFAEYQKQGKRLHKNDLKDNYLRWTESIY